MQVYKENFGGKTNYNIFVPENVNEDTEVLYYTINTSFTEEMKEDIIKQNGDSIVIVPTNSPIVVGNETGGHQFQQEAIKSFNYVKEKYNLKTEQFNQAGFSSGYGPSIRTMSDYLKDNPDAGRQILISVDGCKSANAKGETIYNSEYQRLKENNTIIISYSQKYRQSSEINFLKKTGLPILFVVDPDIPENSQSKWGHYHNVVANNFTERGLYESLLNFAQGKDELPAGYIYQMYDPKTNTINTIDPSTAASYFGIETFDYKLKKLTSLNPATLLNLSVTSDTAYLSGPLNTVINAIKTNAFLNPTSTSEGSFNSTTGIPANLSGVTKTYFDSTVDLLYKLVNDIQEFAKIGPLMDKVDKDLATKELEKINALQNTEQPVPEAITIANTKPESIEENKIEQNNKTDLSTLTNIAAATTLGTQVFNTANNTPQPEVSKDNNEVEQQEQVAEIPEKNKTEIKNETTTEKDNQVLTENKQTIINNHRPSSNNPTSSNNNNNNIKVETLTSETHPIEEFPNYEEIYSDDTKIVYNSDEGYKIIVHKEGNEIIGIEHYYDFKSEESANLALENLKTEYINNENVENIMQQGRYVKVVFQEDMYQNLTIEQVREKYSNYNEIVKL